MAKAVVKEQVRWSEKKEAQLTGDNLFPSKFNLHVAARRHKKKVLQEGKIVSCVRFGNEAGLPQYDILEVQLISIKNFVTS